MASPSRFLGAVLLSLAGAACVTHRTPSSEALALEARALGAGAAPPAFEPAPTGSRPAPAAVGSAAAQPIPAPSVAQSEPVQEWGKADLDPTNDLVVGPPDPVPDCETRLEEAEVRFTPAKLPHERTAGGRITCGNDQVV